MAWMATWNPALWACRTFALSSSGGIMKRPTLSVSPTYGRRILAVRPPMLPSLKSFTGPMRSMASPNPVVIPRSLQRNQVFVEHHHQVGADRQAAGRAQLLVCPEFFRTVDAGLGGAGNAAAEELVAGPFDGVRQLLGGRIADRAGNEPDRAFPQHARWFAMLVPVDHAVAGIVRRPSDAG